MAFHDHVAEFAGETVVAIYELTVDDDTGADACAEGNHDEVAQAACSAVGHFADSSGVSVVGDSYGHAEFVAYEPSQGYWRRPGKIDVGFNATGEIVGIRCSDTDAVDFIGSIVGFDKFGKLGVEFVDIIFNFAVLLSFYRRTCNNNSAGINNTEYGISATYVDTDNIRFCHDNEFNDKKCVKDIFRQRYKKKQYIGISSEI